MFLVQFEKDIIVINTNGNFVCYEIFYASKVDVHIIQNVSNGFFSYWKNVIVLLFSASNVFFVAILEKNKKINATHLTFNYIFI